MSSKGLAERCVVGDATGGCPSEQRCTEKVGVLAELERTTEEDSEEVALRFRYFEQL